MMSDREKILRLARRKGWSDSVSGRTVVLSKGRRTLTATFSRRDENELESFQSGAYAGRGGLRGILRLLETI